MSFNYIQVFGERCTGTNWLTTVIRDNFDVPAGDAIFGKHNWIEDEHIRDDVLYLHVTKDIYSWLLSMAKHRHHQEHTRGLNFSQYIRAPWACFDSSGEMIFERDPQTGRRFINIIEMFNDWISSFYDLHLKNDEEVYITKKYKGQEFSTNFDRRDFFIKKQYLREITPEDFSFINSYLDMETYHSYGYLIENPPVS
jgi:hypothetical protein